MDKQIFGEYKKEKKIAHEAVFWVPMIFALFIILVFGKTLSKMITPLIFYTLMGFLIVNPVVWYYIILKRAKVFIKRIEIDDNEISFYGLINKRNIFSFSWNNIDEINYTPIASPTSNISVYIEIISRGNKYQLLNYDFEKKSDNKITFVRILIKILNEKKIKNNGFEDIKKGFDYIDSKN